MKNSSIIYLLSLISFFGCQKKYRTPISIEINENWSFKNVKDTSWLSAKVPGDVHSDLMTNNKIDDPFIGNNELDLQWVSDEDWDYKTNFDISNEILQNDNIELNFEGLDTYSSVYLNDSLILNTNNAFRQWDVNVKSFLKSQNELRIVFENHEKYENEEAGKLPYKLPEGNRIYTRKAQFQYGWDWGPKLNTLGIWRPIILSSWSNLKIRDVFVKQHDLTDVLATLSANLEISTTLNEKAQVDILVNNNIIATHNIQLNSSKENYIIPFRIENPKLWWTHNLGDPYQYNLQFIIYQGANNLDMFQLKKGLRTIELITEKDDKGESFYFNLNGIPVYMKGANYIPQNSFQNRVTEEHYYNLIDDAVKANMNMLRVWGGGIYENDIFYDLCDEKGILIWQDFMFACAMYPGDDDFLKNVEKEAIDNVKRLRNHASIALWCGNNENSEGWHHWGWQDGRSEKEKKEIWTNYLKFFDSILPKTVAELSDNSSYWESSPKFGRGNPKYKSEGDAHDWWIWHDAYPFEHLEDNVPRFMSEFGFQSFPSYDVINYINQSDSLNIYSEKFESHQKHTRGFQLIKEYMQRDFLVPNNSEDYVYVSQLLQAYGITKGIEAHRRAKPYNMGTIYWQLNDCWPATSWSSIDFFGNWKALHYKAKKAFENTLISSYLTDNTLKTYIIYDGNESLSGLLSLQIMDFEGNELWYSKVSVEVEGFSSEIKHVLDLSILKFNNNEVVIIAKFNNEVSYSYLVKPKDLKLKQGEIVRKITKSKGGFNIELISPTLQKDVFLFCNETGHFSDNYFDLVPNESKVIYFETNSDKLDDLGIKTFNIIIRKNLILN